MKDDKGFKNEDGTLICFGMANEYNDGYSFHCAQLIHAGDCSDLLCKHCWKLSGHGTEYETVV
jgi:hypothetical protein